LLSAKSHYQLIGQWYRRCVEAQYIGMQQIASNVDLNT
jgi:hypothetical protein